MMTLSKDLLRYERNTRPNLIFWISHLGGQKGDSNYTPGVNFLDSHQDLSNEGSNFILSPLEVGHWVAQTWVFFDKLSEITDFGPLQESENKAWFWIC